MGTVEPPEDFSVLVPAQIGDRRFLLWWGTEGVWLSAVAAAARAVKKLMSQKSESACVLCTLAWLVLMCVSCMADTGTFVKNTF